MSLRLLECEDVVQHIFAWLPPGRTIAGVILAHRSFYSALNEIEPRVEQLDTIVEHRRQSYFTAPLSDPAGLVRYQLQLVELAKQQRQAARDAIYPQAEHFDSLREQLEVAVEVPLNGFQAAVDKLRHVRKYDLHESRCFACPPLSHETAINAFFTAIGHKTADGIHYSEWRHVVSSGRIFIILEELQPRALATQLIESRHRMEKLRHLLELPHMQESRMRTGGIYVSLLLARIARGVFAIVEALDPSGPIYREYVVLRDKMKPLKDLATSVDEKVSGFNTAHERVVDRLDPTTFLGAIRIAEEEQAARAMLEALQAIINNRHKLMLGERASRNWLKALFRDEMVEVKYRRMSAGVTMNAKKRPAVSPLPTNRVENSAAQPLSGNNTGRDKTRIHQDAFHSRALLRTSKPTFARRTALSSGVKPRQ